MNFDKKNLDTLLIGAFLDSGRKCQRPLPWETQQTDPSDSSRGRDRLDTAENEPYTDTSQNLSDERYESFRPFSDNRDSEHYPHRSHDMVKETQVSRSTFDSFRDQNPPVTYATPDLDSPKYDLQCKHKPSFLDAQPLEDKMTNAYTGQDLRPFVNQDTRAYDRTDDGYHANKFTLFNYSNRDLYRFVDKGTHKNDIKGTRHCDNQVTQSNGNNYRDHFPNQASKDQCQFVNKATHDYPNNYHRQYPNLATHGYPNKDQRQFANEAIHDYPKKDQRQYTNQATHDYPNKDQRQYPRQATHDYPNKDQRQYPNQATHDYTNKDQRQYPNQATHDYTNKDQRQYPNQATHDYPNKDQRQYPNQVTHDYPSKDQRQYPSQATHDYTNEDQRQYPNLATHDYPNKDQRQYPTKDQRLFANKDTHDESNKDQRQFVNQSKYDYPNEDYRQFANQATHDYPYKDQRQFANQATYAIKATHDYPNKDQRQFLNEATYIHPNKDHVDYVTHDHSDIHPRQPVNQVIEAYAGKYPSNFVTHDYTDEDPLEKVTHEYAGNETRQFDQHVQQLHERKDPGRCVNQAAHENTWSTSKDLSSSVSNSMHNKSSSYIDSTVKKKTATHQKTESAPRGGVSLKASAAVYKTLQDQKAGLFLPYHDKNRDIVQDKAPKSVKEKREEQNAPGGKENYNAVNNIPAAYSKSYCDEKESTVSKVNTDKNEKVVKKKKHTVEGQSIPVNLREVKTKFRQTPPMEESNAPMEESSAITSNEEIVKPKRRLSGSKSSTVRVTREPDEVLRTRRKKTKALHQIESNAVSERNHNLPPKSKDCLAKDERYIQAVLPTDQHSVNVDTKIAKRGKPKRRVTKTVDVQTKNDQNHEKLSNTDTDEAIKRIHAIKVYNNKKLDIKQESQSLDSITDHNEPTSDDKIKVVKISSEDRFEFSNPIQSLTSISSQSEKKRNKTHKDDRRKNRSKQDASPCEKKQKKMESNQKHPKNAFGYAKVHPINIPDDVPKKRSKKDLARIADMFCVEKRKKADSDKPEKKKYEEDSDDEGIRPGVWGCEIGGKFQDKSHVDRERRNTGNLKSEKSKMQRSAKMDRNTTRKTNRNKRTDVDEGKSTKQDEKKPPKTDLETGNDGEEKKRKKGNRFTRFLRRLFRLK